MSLTEGLVELEESLSESCEAEKAREEAVVSVEVGGSVLIYYA